jgi:hypothetical protein
MATTVISIRDHIETSVTTILCTEAMRAAVCEKWETEDPLLARLKGLSALKGKLRLSELTVNEFRTLIALHLIMYAELPRSERANLGNLTVKSLHWLLVGLVICLERLNDGAVSMITITRASDTMVLYDVTLCLARLDLPKGKPGSSLRVIVDNRGG